MTIEQFYKYLPNALNVNGFKNPGRILQRMESHKDYIFTIYDFNSLLNVVIRDVQNISDDLAQSITSKLILDCIQYILNSGLEEEDLIHPKAFLNISTN